jgi:hypothetical protein
MWHTHSPIWEANYKNWHVTPNRFANRHHCSNATLYRSYDILDKRHHRYPSEPPLNDSYISLNIAMLINNTNNKYNNARRVAAHPPRGCFANHATFPAVLNKMQQNISIRQTMVRFYQVSISVQLISIDHLLTSPIPRPTPRSGPRLSCPQHLRVNELNDMGGLYGLVGIISVVLFAAQNVQSTQTVFSVFRFHRRKDLFRFVNRSIMHFVLYDYAVKTLFDRQYCIRNACM